MTNRSTGHLNLRQNHTDVYIKVSLVSSVRQSF